ncbi:MAG: polysaccharide pyruvyl transferase family protein [Verrucomicrobiales bacterium]|nr:polysaccharide pyruvyl transferase family protein [Verrucomicrobiales bacterium]
MTGLYTYHTNNIGDDFQSYVLSHVLKDPVGFVNRDRVREYQGPVTNLIVNGFVTMQALPIPSALNPIILSAWLGPMLLSKKENVSYLRDIGLIGCRDTDSFGRCRELGLEAKMTGCPTILCEPIAEEEPGTILFVDVNPRLFENHREHYRKTSPISRPIQWITNIVPTLLSEEERWEQCRKRHEWMSRAELIVTNRIHVAIPALGMGKAVIFAKDDISIPGRLTALPKSVRIWEGGECAGVELDPAQHRYEVADYRDRVIRELRIRCPKIIEEDSLAS